MEDKISIEDLEIQLNEIKKRFRNELEEFIRPYHKKGQAFLLITIIDHEGNSIEAIDAIGLAIKQDCIK